MNKQELIDKLKKRLGMPSEIDGSQFDQGFEWATKCDLALITKLDEPEKPVVPRCVADWYEKNKDDLAWSLYSLCVDFYKRELQDDLHNWFKYDDNKPIETLVKMKLFGYEVEKEKLYTVEIPNPNGFIRLVLCKDCDGKLFVATFSGGDCWENFGKCKLTESEIKQDFEWAWQFAKEV